VGDRIENEAIDHATVALVVCADFRVTGSANAGVPAFLLARRAVAHSESSRGGSDGAAA
jgi:hypothetical protein